MPAGQPFPVLQLERYRFELPHTSRAKPWLPPEDIGMFDIHYIQVLGGKGNEDETTRGWRRDFGSSMYLQ